MALESQDIFSFPILFSSRLDSILISIDLPLRETTTTQFFGNPLDNSVQFEKERLFGFLKNETGDSDNLATPKFPK